MQFDDVISPIGEQDLAAVLALNNAHAAELSFLEPERLAFLVGQAFRASRIGTLDAFLLGFDQAADYDSPNFLWFRDRYPGFAYVDRVAVAGHARGRGHARMLYEDLFGRARAAGHDIVACEVNTDPPNPVSDAFHARLGFVEVGRAGIEGGKRAVRYYVRRLQHRPCACPAGRLVTLWAGRGCACLCRDEKRISQK